MCDMNDDGISKVRKEIKKEIQNSIKNIDEIGEYFFSKAEGYEKLGNYGLARRCYQSAFMAYDDLSKESSFSEEKREYYGRLSSTCKKKISR